MATRSINESYRGMQPRVMRGMPASPPPQRQSNTIRRSSSGMRRGAPPMPGGAPPSMSYAMPPMSSAPPMPGGPPMAGGPPMPGGPSAVADSIPVQAQRKSNVVRGSKPVLASKQSSIYSDASTPSTPPDAAMADAFLLNLNCDAVKSAADQQEARMAVCEEDWGDMSDEEEVEALLETDAPIQMKVALEFKWLLNQQSASGMFKFSPLDPRFLDYKNKNISSAVQEKLKDVKNLNSVLATLYALASMTTQFASQKTEWQFMFSKGKRWVSKQLKEKKDFDDLLALLV